MDTAAARAISQGSLRAIWDEGAGRAVDEPVLQCVQIKPMDLKNPDQPARYRVIFSDVDNFIQSMMAVQANHIITDGHLKKGSICRLKSFQPNQVKDKRILVILDLEVLPQYGEPEKIGMPVALDPQPNRAEDQPGNISGGAFYGQQQQQQQQQQRPQQQQNSRSLPSRNNQNSAVQSGNLYPIEALSPYAHRWTIRARVTHKTDIKSWHNKNGEGRLFSVNLLDESGEIRATAFSSSNETFDQLYEMLQEGGVYYIHSPCQVKMAKRQFSQVNNDYELTFERDTRVEKADDNDSSVPQVRYNFTNIGGLSDVEKDTTIDTIAILKEVGEINEIVSKTTSKPYSKRDLTLVDDSMHSVRLTIWGNQAQKFDAPVESVVAFKGVKVSDFGGRSLSLLASGSMSINPDIDEAHKLKGWYDAQGANDSYATHNNLSSTTTSTRKDSYKTILDIKEENLGMSEQPDYFSVKATIVFIRKETVSYPACRSPDCNKKILKVDPGQWRCEKCDKTFDRPEYRYVLSFNVSDHTGHLWLSAFDQDARVIMSMTADELQAIEEEGDDKKKSDIFEQATCKSYVFRCSAKMDTFRDEQRVRYQVRNLAPVNFSTEANKLADIIKQYNIGGGGGGGGGLFVN